ncbi:MAG: bifunctional response regulator/alkaline phosphatase family protein, partial [Bacteroidota bacterium]
MKQATVTTKFAGKSNYTMSSLATILWCDDEIELLKPHLLFLSEKGYNIIEASNGVDAIEKCTNEIIDVVFLDEQMPGLSGLETLSRIKALHPALPIVMITKNEEENLMEQAIASQISDYLIKPVKSNQILLTLKKILDSRQLISSKTTSDYQKEFQQIMSHMSTGLNQQEWGDLYRKLIYWELELDKSKTNDMRDVLNMQKSEANSEFCKFVSKNYLKWLNKPDETTPTLSHTLMREKVLPFIDEAIPTFFILIDNLRFDQWKMIQPLLSENFRVTAEDHFYAILPTSTQYSRNAIFAGMTPLEIEKKFPNYWL